MMKRISLIGRKRTRDLGESGEQAVEVTELKKEEILSMKMDKLNNKINEEAKKSGQLIDINLSDIKSDPNQPRRNFVNIDLLADSIKQQGVIQPIIIRSNKNISNISNNKPYIIIAGERRFLAAQKAKIKTIPCIIREEDDVNTLLIQLLENAQREQVAPLEEAIAINKLIKEKNLSKTQIAKELGQPASWISMRLSLLNASSNIKDLIKKQKLEDFRTIHELRKLEEENPSKAKDIINKISQDKLTGSYRSQISEARNNNNNQPLNKSDNINYQDISEISEISFNHKSNLLTIRSKQNSKQLKKLQFKISQKNILKFIAKINSQLNQDINANNLN